MQMISFLLLLIFMKVEKLKIIGGQLRGVLTKCILFQLPISLEYQTWYPLYAKVQPFYLIIKHAKHLIIIFININENFRNERKS